jgi:hypothetical protein
MNDELVRRVRPADPPHDPAVRARALARLRAEFDRRPARRVGWRPVAIGTVALGACAAVVATQIDRPTPPRPVSAAQTLEIAAETVELQTAPPRPRADQWIYTRQMDRFALQEGNVVGPEAMLHGKVTVEEWWRFDGTQMADSIQRGMLYTKCILPKGRLRPPRRIEHVNGGCIGGPGIVNWLPGKLYKYLAGLPTDPDALLARIRHDYRDNGRDVTTFGVISAIFENDHLIPPQTNAALYRALARIPGVQIKRDATDYAGRHGIGVVFARGSGTPRVIVLNPHDYRYMGNTDQAVLDSRVVDSAGQRP